MYTFMVVNVYNSDTGISCPRLYLPAQPDLKQRIHCYRLAITFKVFLNDDFIERKPVNAVILKIVTKCLFQETSISSHLQEIDAVKCGHEQFYCIHEYFL